MCPITHTGDTERQHGGRPYPRRERHPTEEPGAQLPKDELTSRRRGIQGAVCGHHEESDRVNGRSGQIAGQCLEEHESGKGTWRFWRQGGGIDGSVNWDHEESDGW